MPRKYQHTQELLPQIREMCRFFEVSRCGCYSYVKKIDIPSKDLPLADKIRECQEKQYCFLQNRHRTKSYRITPSMSRRGNPYDNASSGTELIAEQEEEV